MKNTLLTTLALAALALALPAHAASITSSVYGTGVTQLPGSPTDFTFIGNGGVLDDFTLTQVGDGFYNGSGSNQDSVITSPLGLVTQTGIEYHNAPPLLNFTLSSSTFDYSDFDVFVAFNNYPDGNVSGEALTLFAPDNTTILVPTVTQDTTYSRFSATSLSVVEFEVKGATMNDVLRLSAQSTAEDTVGAVSFESVPEPSTYALMSVGLIGLAAWQMRKRAGFSL
jgi:hypothetical protein